MVCHRDLKPANIVWQDTEDRWYLVDFGSTELGPTAPPVFSFFEGTAMFACPRALRAGGWCYRYDLESLFYVLYWCLKGSLPWSSLEAPKYGKKGEYLQYEKERSAMPLENIPEKLQRYLETVRKLSDKAQATDIPSSVYSFFE